MDEIVRSVAKSFEMLATQAAGSTALMKSLQEIHPEASIAQLRRGALFALTRPGIAPGVVDVIYDCAMRLRSHMPGEGEAAP